LVEINAPYLIIGFLVSGVGFWLIRAPRNSKSGTFLGPRIYFRLLGVLFLLLGVLTIAAALGLREIGQIPITINQGNILL
jgi:hypothetical protein